MAKCKYWTRKGPYLCYNENTNKCGNGLCPKGANPATCNIIIKPKPKTRTFKAWAWLYPDGEVAAAMINRGASNAPCTITIEAKYLKGEK